MVTTQQNSWHNLSQAFQGFAIEQLNLKSLHGQEQMFHGFGGADVAAQSKGSKFETKTCSNCTKVTHQLYCTNVS